MNAGEMDGLKDREGGTKEKLESSRIGGWRAKLMLGLSV